MKKPEKVLCKRSLIIGEPYYYKEGTDEKIAKDNRMLVRGHWYDIVHNDNDTKETFSIIDNQGCLHLHFMYGEENDNNYNLSGTYAKWFYTPKELAKKLLREQKVIPSNISISEKLYEFLYCDSVYESAYKTISLHRTKAGAWKAMNKWLNERFQREYDLRIRYGKQKNISWTAWKVGTYEAWAVEEKEVLD